MKPLHLLLIFYFLILAFPSYASQLHDEANYRDAWCKGDTGVRLPNGSQADCVTKEYVVEVEFASRCNEALSKVESLAKQFRKKPGILVIIEKPSDWSSYKKLIPIAQKHNVELWSITPYKLQRGH